MDTLLDLPVRLLAASISSGKTTSQIVTRGFLNRVAAREKTLAAWAFIDNEKALADARQVEAMPVSRLKGIPIGVKDIIDTADMPTSYGSAVYAGFRPAADAACVALARAAGAVVLGKTVTAEFALASQGPTRNPVNEAHTPGGSSSGSAAAVAAGMVPLALGSQTGGSLIRPAAYCGVVGYKPSFGLIDRCGTKPLANSLDTLGVIARSVDDAAYFAETLMRRQLLDKSMPKRLRVGLYGVERWSHLSVATRDALHQAAAAFKRAGASLVEMREFPQHEALQQAHQTIAHWEITAALAFECNHYLPRLRVLTQAYLSDTPPLYEAYEAARALAATARAGLAARFGQCDVLLAPAVSGEAPEGIEHAGDPIHCLMWTLLHAPCLTLPVTKGPLGLPVGVQLIGRIRDDPRLLAAGMVLEQALVQSHEPSLATGERPLYHNGKSLFQTEVTQ